MDSAQSVQTYEAEDVLAYVQIVNVDLLVTPLACKLWLVVPTPSAANGLCDVYDGKNANGRPVFSSRDPLGNGTSQWFEPPKPALLHEGLFVHSVNSLVTVLFQPLAPQIPRLP